MTAPAEDRIPFVDDLRAQLVGDAEPGLVAKPRGRRGQVAAAIAAAVLLVAGIGVVVERDGDDDVEVSAAPAVTPILPVADLVGFVFEEALPWPPPDAATTDVRAEVWAAPGDDPIAARPSLLLLTVANPDITDLADDDVSSGILVRGHLAEDATLQSDVPVDAGSLWVERPGLAVTVAVRGADPSLVARVAEGLDLGDGIEDGDALDPATLPDGWERLFAPVELTFFGSGLPLGPGADGYAMAFRSSTTPDAQVSAFVTAGGADDLLALEWLYGAEVADVRGHRAIAGAAQEGSRYLAWREDDATLVTLVGFGVDADGLAAIAASLGPSTEGDLAVALDQLRPTDDGDDDSATSGTATTTLPTASDSTPASDPAAIDVATVEIAGRQLALTFHPDGWPFEGIDVPVLCVSNLTESGGGDELRPVGCSGVLLAAPGPVSTFQRSQEGTGGFWYTTGWVDPSATSVVVRLPDGSTVDAEIVELVSRSSYPFPGNLWIAGDDEGDFDMSSDDLVVEAFAADGTSLGTSDGRPSDTEERVIPITTTEVAGRTIGLTLHPDGVASTGDLVPMVCATYREPATTDTTGAAGSCGGPVDLDRPAPVSLFGWEHHSGPDVPAGWWWGGGWVDPAVDSVVVRLPGGQVLDAEIVELVNRSSYPFPGNLWIVGGFGDVLDLDGAIVQGRAADGSLLGSASADPGVVVGTSDDGDTGDLDYALLVRGDPPELCFESERDLAADRPCVPVTSDRDPVDWTSAALNGFQIVWGWTPRGTTSVVLQLRGVDGGLVATIHPIDPSVELGAELDAWSAVVPTGSVVVSYAVEGDGFGIEGSG
jgi:hypothetical protein